MSFILSLNTDIAYNILMDTPYPEVLSLCNSSQVFREVCLNRTFWNIRSKRDIGISLDEIKESYEYNEFAKNLLPSDEYWLAINGCTIPIFNLPCIVRAIKDKRKRILDAFMDILPQETRKERLVNVLIEIIEKYNLDILISGIAYYRQRFVEEDLNTLLGVLLNQAAKNNKLLITEYIINYPVFIKYNYRLQAIKTALSNKAEPVALALLDKYKFNDPIELPIILNLAIRYNDNIIAKSLLLNVKFTSKVIHSAFNTSSYYANIEILSFLLEHKDINHDILVKIINEFADGRRLNLDVLTTILSSNKITKRDVEEAVATARVHSRNRKNQYQYKILSDFLNTK